MTRVIISGTMTAVALGLGLSTVSAIFYGTAGMPFVVFSSMGFLVGAVGWYRDALSKAILSVDRYPLLLRLHLHANFPAERFDQWTIDRMRSVFRKEAFPRWKYNSMLVASWMTATPALDVSGHEVA